MCGRYGILDPQFIGDRMQLDLWDLLLPPRYNAAPSQRLPVVTSAPDGRRGELMTWGLLPGWAKEGSTPLINARAEGIGSKPSFRAPFQRQRCLVPASHFFEWAVGANGAKVPHLIRLKDEPLFAFAGLYDVRRDASGTNRSGFAIVTTEANDLMAGLHNRMPVILPREAAATWLDETRLDVLQALLRPYPSAAMEAYPVSTLVNRPANDVPEVLLPAYLPS